MNAFLATQLKAGDRCVLPPVLWLYGKQHHLNFRVDFLTVTGQPAATYQAYRQDLLDWHPDTIILDRGEIDRHPDRCFTVDQLAAAGYVEQTRYDRVFRDRIIYDGYRLVIYRRVQNTPPRDQNGRVKLHRALPGAITLAGNQNLFTVRPTAIRFCPAG
jgi:hypothetical protein